jgi:hypothetical protein
MTTSTSTLIQPFTRLCDHLDAACTGQIQYCLQPGIFAAMLNQQATNPIGIAL